MIKNIVRKLSRWAWAPNEPNEYRDDRPQSHLDTLLEGAFQTGMLVYPITNGYLLRIDSEEDAMRNQKPRVVMIFAPDEVGIANEIIAHHARDKLNITTNQREMFSPDQAVKAAHPKSPSRRLTK